MMLPSLVRQPSPIHQNSRLFTQLKEATYLYSYTTHSVTTEHITIERKQTATNQIFDQTPPTTNLTLYVKSPVILSSIA